MLFTVYSCHVQSISYFLILSFVMKKKEKDVGEKGVGR